MKGVVLYATLTGNSQLVAETAAEELDYECYDVMDFAPADLIKYEHLVLVASTWGDGEHNPLGEEFSIALEESKQDLSGLNVSFLGLGDRSYENFCNSINMFKEQLLGMGAKQVAKIHKIDGYPDEEILAAACEWALIASKKAKDS